LLGGGEPPRRSFLHGLLRGLRSLELQGQLGSLEQPLEPAEDLRMGQSELLQRPVADVRRQVVELLVQVWWEGLPELLVDLAVHPAQVVHGARLWADASGFLQDLPGHAGDAEQALRVESLGGFDIFRWSRLGPSGSWWIHHAGDITRRLVRCTCRGRSVSGPEMN
jgi:hypothetical protein